MPDTYASHLPVLQMMLGLVKPKRVLELGSGPHSTPLFLQAGVKLTSLETDEGWFMKAEGYGDFDLRLVEDVVESLPLIGDFDLVFIDNSDNETDREKAIRAVLSQAHPVTVIHDAEYPLYRAAIEEAKNYMIFSDLVPHTAVCW